MLLLIATVSFAASFILPGGYSDSDGMAILSDRPDFNVVSDSMAVVLSLVVVLCPLYTALTNN